MKFKIHMFEEVQRTFEVEAEDMDAAIALVKDPEFINRDPIGCEPTGSYSPDVCIDPLLEDGEVDYDNYRWISTATETTETTPK